LPFAANAALFIVIVVVFEMPLSVASAARHGSNRQHNQKLTLFEIATLAEASG
jgi:hypothetical protein